MRSIALVFVGGALGSLARYALAEALPGLWPVFVVNTVGSFLLGVLLGSLRRGRRREARPQPAQNAPRARVPSADSLRLLLGTGFLGGFTTYSAFALDAVGLGMVGGPVLGPLYAAGSVAFGLVAALLGFGVAGARRVRGGAR